MRRQYSVRLMHMKEVDSMINEYEVVIGIEVHVELKTDTKIFCGCSTSFGAKANTQCCPVCLGLPGSLPVLNEQVVEYAILSGLATKCEITRIGKQDRKNYFYPDSPKAYQISQYDLPLCHSGHVDIEVKGESKRIGITRIHIEEDAGKLVHDSDGGSLIDYNRCGVPLIEIVSEPDIASAEEAKAYVQKLRAILLYVGVSDCKMNEGSLRCDVNLSVRKKGEKTLGTRTEMKNLNSFVSISKAIENETRRQVKLIESGGTVIQETRRWEQAAGKSVSMRTKEDAHDYRYFPDPDLMPIIIDDSLIDKLKNTLPELPDDRKAKYIKNHQLSVYDAEQLVSNKYLSDYFDMTVNKVNSPKIAANLIMSDIIRLLSKDGEEALIPFESDDFARLTDLIYSGVINNTLAKKIIEKMWKENISPDVIIERDSLRLIKDEAYLADLAEEIVSEMPKVVEDYLAGKEKALQSLIGQIMRKTSGKADPALSKKILLDIIND